MRHALSATLAALGLLFAPIALHAPQAQTPRSVEPAQARVIVKYKSSSSAMRALDAATGETASRGPQHAAALSKRLNTTLTDGHPIGRRAQVVFAKGMSSEQLAARLAKEPDVEYAEPDRQRRIRSVPNDPLYAGGQPVATPTVGQWYLRPPTASTVSAINAEGAWNLTHGTSTVVVAVLDTGVRFEHPDLAGKLLAGYDFISDVAHANDGNGRDADPSDPGDWVTTEQVNDPSSPFYHCNEPDPDTGQYTGENSSWHGTQVAGIIGAATHNGTGMASVGRNVMVLPVRVLGRCTGFDSDIQAGMLWAAGLSSSPVPNPTPAKILNLSLGAEGSCGASYTDVVSQLTAAGVTVVVSAGNDAGLAVASPANCPGVIAVAGVRHAGTKVGFSSIGPQVAISAPGGNCVNTTGACLNPLLTTTNTGTTTPGSSTYSDSFVISVGTSFAAPLAAGTAALMLSANPAMTPSQVKSTIQATARPFPSPSTDATLPVCQAPGADEQGECHCTTTTCGAGLLDASAAVSAAVGARATPAPTVPITSPTALASVGVPIVIDGSTAAAPAGRTIASYSWTLESGSAFATLTGATTGSSVTLTPTAAGTVVVKLTVTDSVGAQFSASTSVTVSAGPTAALSASATTVTAGEVVTLDASSSAPSAGRSIVSYQWAITSGSTLATLSSTSGPIVTLNTTAAGSVTVLLTVTDDTGAQSTASRTITVNAVPSTGGGGGGGALGLGWLAALGLAALALARVRPSRR
jgi:serine protease